jgi:predicted NUDIX family NTP pyrophosphohydrolase
MSKVSAGLVMFRVRGGQLEVLLVHPGGPFWIKKDSGAWFIPKGEVGPDEDQFSAAKREFEEETSLRPEGNFLSLGSVKHKSGKTVLAWAFEGDCDPAAIKSNTFTMEWPPKSGKQQQFPEIDRAAFFTVEHARDKIYPAEFELLGRLSQVCDKSGSGLSIAAAQTQQTSSGQDTQRNLFD